MRLALVLTSRWTRAAVFIASLVPAVLLYWRWEHRFLGPNWIERAQHYTGDWILRFLIATLCISPLRKLAGLSALIRYRRMLGLYAFFYACIHFWIYLQFDKAWDWHEMLGDFTRRWFYIFGVIAFVLLIPLAATSYAAAIRWLGGRRWQMLHRLIYVAALAGALHYYLQGKSIVLRAVYYAALIVGLLILRVVMYASRKLATPRAPSRAPAG